jgi:hypothetical protein
MLAAATVVMLLAVTAPLATAAPPYRGYVEEFNPDGIGFPLRSPCGFEIIGTPRGSVAWTVFVDEQDNVIREEDHFWEQDTFTANGKTLVGEPYRLNQFLEWDSSGNLIRSDYSGVIEKITLPDGTRVFFSAGRADALAGPPGPVQMFITPDSGRSGNFDAFCAYLAP